MANNGNNATVTVDNKDDDRDHYSDKPLMFDGEKFDYQKDIIESYFLGYDLDLWDLVVDGYTHPVDNKNLKISKSAMIDAQKKVQRNHYKAITILLSAISYNEYEKITYREATKSIFKLFR